MVHFSLPNEVRLVKTRMSELKVGDDVGAWLDVEIPKWQHPYRGEAYLPDRQDKWVAASPTYEVDGVMIEAASPSELVERVRTIERMVAIVADRQGSIPVVGPLAGLPTTTPVVPEPKFDPTLTTLSMAPADVARFQGYTGEICTACGSMKTIRIGKCIRCAECNHAGECG